MRGKRKALVATYAGLLCKLCKAGHFTFCIVCESARLVVFKILPTYLFVTKYLNKVKRSVAEYVYRTSMYS